MDTSEHYCRCHLCDADEAGLGADTYMESITDHIARVGWAVPAVCDDEQGPAWAYSVGIWHTHGGPELAMFGCPAESMAGIINAIGCQIADGAAGGVGDAID